MTRPAARMAVAVVVAAFAACGAGAAAPGSGRLDSTQAAELVRAHNAWRHAVGVAPLRWSPDLARRAQSRADNLAAHGCKMEHGRLPADIGENLFRAGALRYSDRRPDEVATVAPHEVVDAWAAEKRSYDHARNRCGWRKHCGHYTQIVWEDTREVGCGMAVCKSRGQVWVCDYRPAGNVEGGRPY